MKKTLLTIIVMGMFCLMPVKPMAMVEYDEKGNVIEKAVEEGVATIMMAPDETTTNDQSVSSDDSVIYQTTAIDTDIAPVTEDRIRTTSAEMQTTSVKGDNKNVLPIVITSGASGIALGAVATVIIKKRKND